MIERQRQLRQASHLLLLSLVAATLLLGCGCSTITVDPPITGTPPPPPPGQNLETQLKKRYAHYRTRMDANFVSVGSKAGQSLVAHQVADGHIGWWADALVVHGWYLAVLATEHNRAESDADRTEAARQLRYALQAIDRLDRKAEPTLSDDKIDPDINGFYIRDDVDASVLQYFNGDMKLTEINSDLEMETKLQNKKSAMSQDQLISLLFGLAMVNKFCLDEELRIHAREIFRRAYAQVSENNWTLYLPRAEEDDEKKKVPRGPSAKALSYGIESLAKDVLGNDLPGAECFPFSRFVFDFVRVSKPEIVPKTYNRSMLLVLGSMTDVWEEDAQKVMKGFGRKIYPLLYAVYHDLDAKTKLVYNQELYSDMLALAPEDGPHSDGPAGWNSWNRFYSPPVNQPNWAFAGLDYMLLYNLYQMRFFPQTH